MTSALGRVFIYGGKGALGAACVSHFKNKNWWVASIDLKENESADANVIVKTDDSWADQETKVLMQVGELLKGSKVDAVICVAGGWAGGNAASKGQTGRPFEKRYKEHLPRRELHKTTSNFARHLMLCNHNYSDKKNEVARWISDLVKNCDLMWRQSIWSSVIAVSIAVHHLKEGGLISLPGAKPAVGPTPGMIGYGMAKAAVHHLTKSLAAENSGLPQNALAVSILPITLDTPMNRKWMPKADTSTWTPLEFVADLFFRWSEGKDRPLNGSLVQLVTTKNVTELVLV